MPFGFIAEGLLFLYNQSMKRTDVWAEYNPNPVGRRVGDCSVRAIAKALDLEWEDAFWLMCANAAQMGDMPSSDAVWGSVLRQRGYFRTAIPNVCPTCYTAEDFCRDNPKGTYVLGFGGHVACVRDGVLYDSWDSSQELPQFFWFKKEA